MIVTRDQIKALAASGSDNNVEHTAGRAGRSSKPAIPAAFELANFCYEFYVRFNFENRYYHDPLANLLTVVACGPCPLKDLL
jgi:hypothetical protein